MNRLVNGLNDLDIKYTDLQLQKVDKYYELLFEKNKVINLTRITDRDEFYTKHILDSLLVTKVYKFENQFVIDIGTGAGFPGIPLSIFYPDLQLVLLDSVNKKLLFIDEVSEIIGLNNIRTVHGRAEDIAHVKDYREKFDLVLSRAVADLSVLSELCIPFIKVNGSFIAYKSYNSDEEIKKSQTAINILSGSAVNSKMEIIPGTDIMRTLVIVNKKFCTDNKYPRKPGVPNRNPLGD